MGRPKPSVWQPRLHCVSHTNRSAISKHCRGVVTLCSDVRHDFPLTRSDDVCSDHTRSLTFQKIDQVKMNFGEWFVDGNIFMKSGVTIDARYGTFAAKWRAAWP